MPFSAKFNAIHPIDDELQRGQLCDAAQLAQLPLRALYLDLNSYFASVEQQLNPALRGKVVGVLPVMAETTCCIAASIEAKQYGIKTGTMVAPALEKFPDIIFVKARFHEYVDAHHAIIAAVDSIHPITAVRSIDEMWCTLRGRDCQETQARQLALDIKTAIYQQVGDQLHCSVGIAPNRYLAKLASNLHKPNGLEVLYAHEVQQRIAHWPLRALNGIGSAMEKRLLKYKINTINTLFSADLDYLQTAWGNVEGARMWAMLRGAWLPELVTRKSSISHSRVLDPAYRHREGALGVLNQLCQKAAVRLRQQELYAGALQIKIKLLSKNRAIHLPSWHQQAYFTATQNTTTLLKVLENLCQRFELTQGTEILQVGIVLSHFSDPKSQNLSLFEQFDETAAAPLHHAIDKINQKFGRHAIYFAGAHDTLEKRSAPIAFGHIPRQDE